MVVLIEGRDKGLEKLVVTDTARFLLQTVRVIHGEVRQNALQLRHLVFPLLHGFNDILRVDRTFLEKMLNAIEFVFQRFEREEVLL